MATRTLSTAVTKTSGRTILLTFDGGSTPWPTYNSGLTVTVNGGSVGFAVNTAVGGNPWKLYVTLDAFVVSTDTITVSGTAGMMTNTTDTSASFSAVSVTNNSNRQTDKMDTLCLSFNDTPWRYISATRQVGVIGFDNVDGNAVLDRIEYSINGSGFTAVTSMAWNADNALAVLAPNGVWEYKVPVDPTGLADGTKITVTVRGFTTAAASPYKEISINFWANIGGTCDSTIKYISTTGSDSTGDGSSGTPYRSVLKALQSLAAGAVHGGKIEIKDNGDYFLDNVTSSSPLQFKGMVTVQAGAGASAGSIVFRPTGGTGTPVRLRSNRICFNGAFKFRWDEITQIDPTGGAGSGDTAGYIWWQNSSFQDSSLGNASNSLRYASGTMKGPYSQEDSGVHLTNCSWDSPIYAYAGIQRSMNNTITNAQADICSNTRLTVNLWVKNGTSLGTSGPHGDGFQQFDDDLRGAIHYGIFAKQMENYQGNYWTDLFDHVGVALVNHSIDIQLTSGGAYQTQFRSLMENCLLLNCTNTGQAWTFRDDWHPRGRISFVNCIAKSWSVSTTANTQWTYTGVSSTRESNHFNSGTTYGTNPSSGTVTPFWPRSDKPNTPTMGYGGPGSPACRVGKNYAKWTHPGVLLNSVDVRGAFGLTGDTVKDEGGAVSAKPLICALNTAHEKYSTWRRAWAFDSTDKATWDGGTQSIRDLAGVVPNSGLTIATGATTPTWDTASAYGYAMAGTALYTATTDSQTFPFQLVTIAIAPSSLSGTRYTQQFSETGTNRNYATKVTGTTYAAQQNRFGSETGASVTVGSEINSKLILNVSQFVGLSERHERMYLLDTMALYSADDVTAVTAVNALRDVVGVQFGSTLGGASLYPGEILFAGRTNAIWTDAEILRFATNIWGFLVQVPGVPTGLAGTPTTSKVTLSWNATATATGYRVYKAGILIYDGTATTVDDFDVLPSTTYGYKVSAYNVGGEGSQSSQVDVTTLAVSTSTIMILNSTTLGGDDLS